MPDYFFTIPKSVLKILNTGIPASRYLYIITRIIIIINQIEKLNGNQEAPDISSVNKNLVHYYISIFNTRFWFLQGFIKYGCKKTIDAINISIFPSNFKVKNHQTKVFGYMKPFFICIQYYC